MARPPATPAERDRKRKIGLQIKAARRERGLSQVELGRLVGVGNQTVCDWEHDRGIPGPVRLRQIAEITDRSVSFFTQERLMNGSIPERLARSLIKRIGQRRLLALLRLSNDDLRDELDHLIQRHFGK